MFVLIAFQLGFASREALADPEAIEDALAPAARVAVQAGVAAHIAQAKGDTRRALSNVPAPVDVRQILGIRGPG